MDIPTINVMDGGQPEQEQPIQNSNVFGGGGGGGGVFMGVSNTSTANNNNSL